MKLNQYLKREKISIAKFAMKCGIPFPTISKYYYGEKIPRQENMHKIYECTEKKVDANDFYGITSCKKDTNFFHEDEDKSTTGF